MKKTFLFDKILELNESDSKTILDHFNAFDGGDKVFVEDETKKPLNQNSESIVKKHKLSLGLGKIQEVDSPIPPIKEAPVFKKG